MRNKFWRYDNTVMLFVPFYVTIALFYMRGFGRLWARPFVSSTDLSVLHLSRDVNLYKNKIIIQE